MIKVANIQPWQLIQEIESETLKFFYIFLMTKFYTPFFFWRSLRYLALPIIYFITTYTKYLEIYYRQSSSVYYIYYIKRFEV